MSKLFSGRKRYIKRFELLCDSLKITGDKQKLSLLLTLIGDNTYEIYENLPQDTLITYRQAVDAFNEDFKSQFSLSYEIFTFRKMDQRTDETTQQFFVHLHEQLLKCEFADKDKEIKQQIELSTNISKLRKYSFQNPNQTLQDLLTIAKSFELMDNQMILL